MDVLAARIAGPHHATCRCARCVDLDALARQAAHDHEVDEWAALRFAVTFEAVRREPVVLIPAERYL